MHQGVRDVVEEREELHRWMDSLGRVNCTCLLCGRSESDGGVCRQCSAAARFGARVRVETRVAST
jgi:hypothetical protein